MGVDLTALLPQTTGVDKYLLELLGGLAKVDSTNRYSVFINREDKTRIPALGENFRQYAVSTRHRPLRLLWQQGTLPPLAAANQIDVIHSPSFILPLVARRSGQVLSVHDLTPLTHPQTHIRLRRSPGYLTLLRASIHRADVISVPTEAVRSDMLRLMPEAAPRTRVVPYGISDEFRPVVAERLSSMRHTFELPRPYVLFVGTVQPRKNLETLLRAYARLASTDAVEEDLVIAGMAGWDHEPVRELVRTPELEGRVRLLGYVEQSWLPALYAGATLFAYPSLAEGFGFPALEAMACGTPVVASDIPVFRELLGDAAELVAPEDPDGWTDALAGLLRDPGRRAHRRSQAFKRAASFRWETTARATIGCYEEAARRAQRRRPRS